MSCIKMDVDSRKTFEKEFAAWNRQNFQNYQFSYQYFSLSLPSRGPVKITIEEGNESVIEHPYTRIEVVPYTSIAQLYEWIDYLFEDTAKMKLENKGLFRVKSITLRIEYDTQYHYPKKIFYGLEYVKLTEGGPYIEMEVIAFHAD